MNQPETESNFRKENILADLIKDVPTLPQVAMELVRLLFNEDANIAEAAALIEKDATLTAKLFKTVNNASFGLRVEVNSICQAINLIGLRKLRFTVLTIALGEYFTKGSFGRALDPKRFFLHSLATAVILRETAKLMGHKNAESLYLLGLLHDLGQLALDAVPGKDYGEALRGAANGGSLIESERAVFGIDHRTLWDELAKAWSFPQELQTLSRSTVSWKERAVPVKDLACCASRMADSLGFFFIDPRVQERFIGPDWFGDLEQDELLAIRKSVMESIQVLGPVLELPAPDEGQVIRMLWRIAKDLKDSNERFYRLNQDLEIRVEVLQELTRVFTGIIKSLNHESLAFSVLEALIDGFDIESAFLLHSSPDNMLKGYTARSNLDNGEAGIERILLKPDEISPSMKQCIRQEAPLRVDRPLEEPVLVKCLGQVAIVWLAPIFVRGHFSSILSLGIGKNRMGKFTHEDFGKIVHIVAGEIGLSIENSRLYNRMRREARTDSLTGLNNRRTIMAILGSEFARFQRRPLPLTVAIFDMDNFKAINDTRGHLAGDDFLVETARLLKEGLRESDFIGRYGGDEFIAVFPQTTPEEAEGIVTRIRQKVFELCKRIEGPDLVAKLSVSVGIAGAEESMSRADVLIKLADEALYQAKDAGRNQCMVFGNAPAS